MTAEEPKRDMYVPGEEAILHHSNEPKEQSLTEIILDTCFESAQKYRKVGY